MTAGRVILISEFLKKIVNKHFSPDKISVIRSSVDENLCRKLLKKTVPGSENEFVISVLGVITPSKNQMLILKALENINVSENIRLNIIGRVEDEKYYRNLLAFSELNIKHPVEVVFTGELSKDDAVEKIIESDLIVITSKYEGMSLVLAEALYLGKPVVSTRTGVAEEIISDGINGFLINSNDYVKLQNIIKDIIDKPDLRTQITSKHTYYYTKYFSMDFYLKQHEKLIANVS